MTDLLQTDLCLKSDVLISHNFPILNQGRHLNAPRLFQYGSLWKATHIKCGIMMIRVWFSL